MLVRKKKKNLFIGSGDLSEVSKKTLVSRLAMYGLSSSISLSALGFGIEKVLGGEDEGTKSQIQTRAVTDYTNKTQYALARNAQGCEILVRYDFFNEDGNQYTLQTEFLPKNYKSCHN